MTVSLHGAAVRLVFLEALIGPDFELELSLRLDQALIDVETLAGRWQGGYLSTGVLGRHMKTCTAADLWRIG